MRDSTIPALAPDDITRAYADHSDPYEGIVVEHLFRFDPTTNDVRPYWPGGALAPRRYRHGDASRIVVDPLGDGERLIRITDYQLHTVFVAAPLAYVLGVSLACAQRVREHMRALLPDMGVVQ